MAQGREETFRCLRLQYEGDYKMLANAGLHCVNFDDILEYCHSKRRPRLLPLSGVSVSIALDHGCVGK